MRSKLALILILVMATPQLHAKWSLKKKILTVTGVVVAVGATAVIVSMRNNGWYNKYCGTLPGRPGSLTPRPGGGYWFTPPEPPKQYGGGC